MLGLKKQQRENFFCNEKYSLWRKQDEQAKKEKSEAFLKSDKTDLYSYVTEVAIQLSNLCNYASIHKRCPASCESEKIIMPLQRAISVINELGKSNWKGLLCFHIYNEPLIDPRLFFIINYAKNTIKGVEVEVYSNGFYLNDVMVHDLIDVGVDVLIVTGYGITEFERLKNLNVTIPYSLILGNLDARLDLYGANNDLCKGIPCKSFISQVCIFADGEIGLCCLDFLHPYKIGNITINSLKSCLNNEKNTNLQTELCMGIRSYKICKNCNWAR